jgi:hypothetical protein
MAKLLLALLFVLLFVSALSAYTGEVHEEIVRQALEYLSHISYFENYTKQNNHDAVKALLQSAIDEDTGDWIYGYGKSGMPEPYVSGVSDASEIVIQGYIKTITHFWNADLTEPVNSSGHNLVEGKWLGGKYTIHNIPSAQRKAERMIYGNNIHHDRTMEFKTPLENLGFATVPDLKGNSQRVNLHSANGAFRFSIYSVDDYILNHNILILGHYLKNNKYVDYDTTYYIHLTDRDWTSLMYQTDNCEEYRYLGRLAHLLSDMSVPTHTHNDIHGVVPVLNSEKITDCDQYEGWDIPSLNSHGGYLYTSDAIKWTAADVAKVYGYELIPLPVDMNSEEFLYHLFYTVNQVASMFPSNDCGGNFTANPEHPFSQYPFITDMQSKIMEMHGGSVDFQKRKGQNMSDKELDNIQNICIPMAIRAVATVLYWWGCHYNYPHTEISVSD